MSANLDQSRALSHYVPMAREAELHATIERLHADLCAARRELRLLKSEDPAQLVRWSTLPGIVRGLGMPQANEDAVRVVRALSHVIAEAGYENAEECLQLLGFVAECVEELRPPPPMTPEEQRAADREHRREMEDDDRRAGY